VSFKPSVSLERGLSDSVRYLCHTALVRADTEAGQKKQKIALILKNAAGCGMLLRILRKLVGGNCNSKSCKMSRA